MILQRAEGDVTLAYRGSRGEGLGSVTLSLTNVRVLRRDSDLDKWECAADLVIRAPTEDSPVGSDSTVFPITYQSELADEGRTHYVSILSARDPVRR
jgi:hypothetical protein